MKGTMKKTAAAAAVLLMLGGCAQQPVITPQKACMNSVQLNTYGYEHLEKVAKLLREDKKNIDSLVN